MDIRTGCKGCRSGDPLPFPFTMAFQPIVDISANTIWGYEALVRGVDGQSAGEILAQVNDDNRYKFDQACRVKAIEIAGTLFDSQSSAKLSINFMPNAVYEPSACIRATLLAAERAGFDPSRIMFEFTEDERIEDPRHVERIVTEYKRLGFTTAIDDFGSGYSGLGLLAKFQPDVIKIDMDLIRGVDKSLPRQGIVAGIMVMALAMKVTVIAEGVETSEEVNALRSAGVRLLQGYHFARPLVEALPLPTVLRGG